MCVKKQTKKKTRGTNSLVSGSVGDRCSLLSLPAFITFPDRTPVGFLLISGDVSPTSFPLQKCCQTGSEDLQIHLSVFTLLPFLLKENYLYSVAVGEFPSLLDDVNRTGMEEGYISNEALDN